MTDRTAEATEEADGAQASRQAPRPPAADRAFPAGRHGKAASRTIYLDITDLIQYAEHNRTLSGIQRVNASLLANVEAWCAANPGLAVVPVVPEYDRFNVLAVDFGLVRTMFQMLETPTDHRGTMRQIIQALFASRVQVELLAGDVFVMAGAFWICQHYDMLIGLRHRGVHFALFIHDLIQINNPEYVQHVATVTFAKSLIDALGVADIVLTNSAFVASEVRTFLEQRLHVSVPVEPVLLATELPTLTAPPAIKPDIRRVARRDYVLCVGTIEVRKNHVYLTRIWERLVAEFGESVPDLVFAGKWGWKIDDLQEHLGTNPLPGRLHIFNAASDVELAFLYEHCLFTAYPSFAEGFGLPVGESLAYGKPCVTSNTTSLPEVGGTLARYTDPMDADQGYAVFAEILADRAALERWTEEVRANYRPKPWRAFAIEFFDALLRLAKQAELDPRVNNCLLAPRGVVPLGDEDVLRMTEAGSAMVTFRMARAAGWHPVEAWGCWASSRRGTLRFYTPFAEGAPIHLALRLLSPPGTREGGCTVTVGGQDTRLRRLVPHHAWYLAEGTVGPHGAVTVDLVAEGPFGQPDSRSLYVGISALAYCAKGDAQALRTFYAKTLVSSLAPALRTGARLIRGDVAARARTAEQQRAEARRLVETAIDAYDNRRAAQETLVQLPQGEPFGGRFQTFLPNPAVMTTLQPYMTAANCLARDFYRPEFTRFCEAIGHEVTLHRQLWEMAFIAHHLEEAGVLAAGRRGIKLGTGSEQLASLFAAAGCDVTIVPRPRPEGADGGAEAILADSFFPAILAEDAYAARVRLEGGVAEEAGEGDFGWSCGGVEPVEDVEADIGEIVGAVGRRLRPGGVVCVTRDLNLSSNAPATVGVGRPLYRRRDIERLGDALAEAGHHLEALPVEAGMTYLDTLVDMPPFGGLHLKVQVGEAVATSFGMVITRGTR